MECDLGIGGCGEPIDGYERNIARHEQAQTCCECGREIAPNVDHELVTGDLGAPFVVRTCLDCVDIAEALQTEGRDHGQLWDQLEEEEYDDGPGFSRFNSGCLKHIKRASAKAYLQHRYVEWLKTKPPMGEN